MPQQYPPDACMLADVSKHTHTHTHTIISNKYLADPRLIELEYTSILIVKYILNTHTDCKLNTFLSTIHLDTTDIELYEKIISSQRLR